MLPLINQRKLYLARDLRLIKPCCLWPQETVAALGHEQSPRNSGMLWPLTKTKCNRRLRQRHSVHVLRDGH